jgi:hypothetical protein
MPDDLTECYRFSAALSVEMIAHEMSCFGWITPGRYVIYDMLYMSCVVTRHAGVNSMREHSDIRATSMHAPRILL